MSLPAKFKMLVSFYQVLSSFEEVYGISLSETVLDWLYLLSFDIQKIFLDKIGCFGISTRQRILLGTLWPYFVIFSGMLILIFHKFIAKKVDFKQMMKQSIQLMIVVFYFALPMVCKGTFDAIKCKAFQADDNQPEPLFRSYLLIDMRIQCDRGDINNMFYALFTLWGVITPLGFLIILCYIAPSVRSGSITFLANSCRFLWQDYNPSMLFWDFIDTMRKLLLTGFIMFIDIREGSRKMLRLTIATLVSVLYLGIMLAFHPYKRNDDYYLAFISNFLLIACFALGTLLKLCGDGEGEECTKYVGYSMDYTSASYFVLILAVGLLLVTLAFIFILAVNVMKRPTVQMKSSENSPNLELPENMKHHVFVSHIWSSGQARTHAIVRKMQLSLPGVKIWLDVDNLEDLALLEESVASSAVFLLFYSKHYFRSKNCRREVVTALKLNKPIIIVYEGDESVVEEMKREYQDCFNINTTSSAPSSSQITPLNIHLDYSFFDNAIQWLNDTEFAAAVLKRIFTRVFENLPYYQNHPDELEKGIIVPGELHPVRLVDGAFIDILFHEDNQGSFEIALELMKMSNSSSNTMRSPRNRSQPCNVMSVSDYYSQSTTEDKENQLSEQDAEQKEGLMEFPGGTASTITTQYREAYFLLYLNKNTFQGNNDGFIATIKHCIEDPNINIVLVHERSLPKEGCEFDEFFKTTPDELFNPPYNLYSSEIAIPLYAVDEYRIVSLMKILRKMGARPVTQSRRSSSIRNRRNSMRRSSSTLHRSSIQSWPSEKFVRRASLQSMS